jgi:hypothetical protein
MTAKKEEGPEARNPQAQITNQEGIIYNAFAPAEQPSRPWPQLREVRS